VSFTDFWLADPEDDNYDNPNNWSSGLPTSGEPGEHAVELAPLIVELETTCSLEGWGVVSPSVPGKL